MNNKFKNGDVVIVNPLSEDFFHQFSGTIVGFRKDLIQVKDQDDDVWEVSSEQLEFLNEN